MSKAKNRELFNEAIADAKAIKDMAIENAKKAIAESFTPQIHKMLATKLEEMEQEELEETELTNEEVESTNEGEIDESKSKSKKPDAEEEEGSKEPEKETNENLNLDELLAELEEGSNEEEEALNEDLDEAKKADDKKDDKKAEKDEEEEEEEIDLESMSPEDLEDLIKGVIKDMTASGELEGGSEGEETGEEEPEEDEISIDEILKSLGEGEIEEGGSTFKSVDKKAVDAKSVEYYEKAHEKVKEELEEAVTTINEMKKTLNEVNLLNAKLLYTNKIFKSKNLNESQKVKVLNSFDQAKSVKESKLVYELLMESLTETKKQPIREHRSTASSVIGGSSKTTKKPILENVDPQVARFRKLAGL